MRFDFDEEIWGDETTLKRRDNQGLELVTNVSMEPFRSCAVEAVGLRLVAVASHHVGQGDERNVASVACPWDCCALNDRDHLVQYIVLVGDLSIYPFEILIHLRLI